MKQNLETIITRLFEKYKKKISPNKEPNLKLIKKIRRAVLMEYLNQNPNKSITFFSNTHLAYKTKTIRYDYYFTTEHIAIFPNGAVKHMSLLNFIKLIEESHA